MGLSKATVPDANSFLTSLYWKEYYQKQLGQAQVQQPWWQIAIITEFIKSQQTKKCFFRKSVRSETREKKWKDLQKAIWIEMDGQLVNISIFKQC